MTKNFKMEVVSKEKLDRLAGDDVLVTEGMYSGEEDTVYLIPEATELTKYHEIGHALRNPRSIPSTIGELLDDEILATKEGLKFGGKEDLGSFELYSKNITQAIQEAIEAEMDPRDLYRLVLSKMERFGIRLTERDKSRIRSYIKSLKGTK